jgi:hypothetical protein
LIAVIIDDGFDMVPNLILVQVDAAESFQILPHNTLDSGCGDLMPAWPLPPGCRAAPVITIEKVSIPNRLRRQWRAADRARDAPLQRPVDLVACAWRSCSARLKLR